MLGSRPMESDERDAIHVAIIPAAAGVELLPGQHVELRNGLAMPTTPGIGIVDPFLTTRVGQLGLFWLCLYPDTVTGMRHHWTHPAFNSDEDDKKESEAWLRAFLDNGDYPSYNTMIRAATEGYVDEDSFHIDGGDAHGTIPREFWDHLENVTGMTFTARPTYFSCAC